MSVRKAKSVLDLFFLMNVIGQLHAERSARCNLRPLYSTSGTRQLIFLNWARKYENRKFHASARCLASGNFLLWRVGFSTAVGETCAIAPKYYRWRSFSADVPADSLLALRTDPYATKPIAVG